MIVAAVFSFIAMGTLGTTGNFVSRLAQLSAGFAGLSALIAFFVHVRLSRKRASVSTPVSVALCAEDPLDELKGAISRSCDRIADPEMSLTSLSSQVLTDAQILLPFVDAIIGSVPKKTEQAAFSLMEKFLVVREASGRAASSARLIRTELEDTRSEKSIQFTADNSRCAVTAERASIRELYLCTRENRDHLQAMKKEIDMGLELLKSITEITERSKLIAFNMSIEAARMGEKGRGVKVITIELHKLNDRTFDFSRQIATLLGRFKEYNTLLVSNMEEKASVVIQEVEKGIDAAESAVESLIGASTRTEEFTREIARMSEEINKGLDGVLESLQFQDITRQMVEGAQSILGELARSIDGCLADCRVPIDTEAKNARFNETKQRLIALSKTKDEKNALMEVRL